MAITLRIVPSALLAGGPLFAFASRGNQTAAGPLQYPQVPLPLGTTGTTGAPGPGFIASASPLGFRSNINEDGTFPTAPDATITQTEDVYVHVSPTSGSTVVRGNGFTPENTEFDPTYGLNIGVNYTTMTESLFESAISDPIGGQFLSNLQDLVIRNILEVAEEGIPMTSVEIRDFIAAAATGETGWGP